MGDQLGFLITICFSFSILILTYAMNRGSSTTKLMGATFFVPFLLSIFAFLNPRTLNFASATTLAELMLVMVILILAVLDPEEHNHQVLRVAIFAFPMALMAILKYLHPGPNFLESNQPRLILMAGAVANIMYIYVRDRHTRNTMFKSMLFLLLSALSHSYTVLFLIFKGLAYFCFFMHFYNASYGTLVTRTAEAEKRLSNLEKTINLEVKKRMFEIERSNQNLLLISKTDSLTKAYNKQAITTIIDNHIASKSVLRFTVMIFDIDHFKTINDTMGHVAGDMVLKKIAHAAKTCIRDIDSLGRYGGDEFLVILPNTTVREAIYVAERFRLKVEQMEGGQFTVSIGLSSYPEDGDNFKTLIAKADEGLYLAKKRGRNRISYVSQG
ncbi:MAG: diguanylate cyclase [Acidobacteriota bacterium]